MASTRQAHTTQSHPDRKVQHGSSTTKCPVCGQALQEPMQASYNSRFCGRCCEGILRLTLFALLDKATFCAPRQRSLPETYPFDHKRDDALFVNSADHELHGFGHCTVPADSSEPSNHIPSPILVPRRIQQEQSTCMNVSPSCLIATQGINDLQTQQSEQTDTLVSETSNQEVRQYTSPRTLLPFDLHYDSGQATLPSNEDRAENLSKQELIEEVEIRDRVIFNQQKNIRLLKHRLDQKRARDGQNLGMTDLQARHRAMYNFIECRYYRIDANGERIDVDCPQ